MRRKKGNAAGARSGDCSRVRHGGALTVTGELGKMDSEKKAASVIRMQSSEEREI